MSVHHRVAFALLAVLIGLPAAATACAMACDVAPLAVASGHQSCESMASPSAGERMTAAAPYDCTTHDAAVTGIAATAPERTAFSTMDVTLASAMRHSASASASSSQSIVRILAPPGVAPPTAPLVLRI